MEKLEIPCAYQGGKQRIAPKIVENIDKFITKNTQIFDLCCGSGAVSLELINSKIDPKNIICVDISCWGAFYESIGKNFFSLEEFKHEIDLLPKDVSKIQAYLRELSEQPVNPSKFVYHYLLLQAGSFGSKQIYIRNNKWCNNTFRSYWLPTETSNRKSPVNPMMPMPDTLFTRVEKIVRNLGGKIQGNYANIYDFIDIINNTKESVVYMDPPYINTTAYGFKFDYMDFLSRLKKDKPIFVSESYKFTDKAVCISESRSKGNINGIRKTQAIEEWLNFVE